MKTYGGSVSTAPHLTLIGGVSFTPCQITSWETAPLYSVEGIPRLGASLDAVERRNVSYTSLESNPDFVQPVGWCEEKIE
jgi:hypothetical protein